MTNRSSTLLLLAACAALTGCDDKKPQPPLTSPSPAPTAAPAPAPAPAAATPPANHPTTQVPHADAGNGLSAMGVTLTLPATWKRNPPANQMRLAEAIVPDASGDPAKSSLVVFSTAGGDVASNLARWSGQVRDAKGQPVQAKPQTQSVGGISVSTVELTGSFAGMGDTAPKDNWTLLGAVIEAPEGLLFVKMTGPAASVAAASKDFDALLKSVKKP